VRAKPSQRKMPRKLCRCERLSGSLSEETEVHANYPPAYPSSCAARRNGACAGQPVRMPDPPRLSLCQALNRPRIRGIRIIGILAIIGIIGRIGGRGMNGPIASPFTKARSAKFVVNASGAPATTGVVNIAANRRSARMLTHLRRCGAAECVNAVCSREHHLFPLPRGEGGVR
jgi:hypothetical protein